MANNSYKKVIALGLDYSEFQGGIKECKDEMKKLDSEHKKLSAEMENTASASDKLAEKNEYLTKKIELQSKKVDIAKEKLEQLKNSESATEAQVRKAATAFNNEAAELASLNNELMHNAVEQSNVKQAVTALVAVLTTVGAAASACVRDVMDFADELVTLSAQTGVSVQTLQEWQYASDFIDTSFETMTSALQKLEKAMANSPDVFRQLGVSVTDASGNMRSAEEVFYETIDALGQISNATEQDQIAMQIFGRSAQELTGVIDAGSSGLREYGMEAKALGLILSDDEVQSAAAAKDAFDQLTKTFDSVKLKIGAELAPVIQTICSAIAQIPAPVLATVAAITALIAVIATAIVTIGSVVRAFNSISSAVGLATATMNPNLLIVLAIVAALALLAAAIAKIVQLYKEWRKEQELINNATANMADSLSIGGGGGSNRTAGHKASGGITNGERTWVGENGPELVDLPAGSRVYNNNETKQMMGNTTYNINMSMDLSKMKSVNDVVKAVQGLGMAKTVGV